MENGHPPYPPFFFSRKPWQCHGNPSIPHVSSGFLRIFYLEIVFGGWQWPMAVLLTGAGSFAAGFDEGTERTEGLRGKGASHLGLYGAGKAWKPFVFTGKSSAVCHFLPPMVQE